MPAPSSKTWLKRALVALGIFLGCAGAAISFSLMKAGCDVRAEAAQAEMKELRGYLSDYRKACGRFIPMHAPGADMRAGRRSHLLGLLPHGLLLQSRPSRTSGPRSPLTPFGAPAPNSAAAESASQACLAFEPRVSSGAPSPVGTGGAAPLAGSKRCGGASAPQIRVGHTDLRDDRSGYGQEKPCAKYHDGVEFAENLRALKSDPFGRPWGYVSDGESYRLSCEGPPKLVATDSSEVMEVKE